MNLKKHLIIFSIVVTLLALFVTVTLPGKILLQAALYNINPGWFVLDETITENSWNGISMGSSKLEVWNKLKEFDKDTYSVDLKMIEHQKQGPLVSLSQIDEPTILFSQEQWKLHIEKSMSNYVIFIFNGNTLVSIRRFKKTIEFA